MCVWGQRWADATGPARGLYRFLACATPRMRCSCSCTSVRETASSITISGSRRAASLPPPRLWRPSLARRATAAAAPSRAAGPSFPELALVSLWIWGELQSLMKSAHGCRVTSASGGGTQRRTTGPARLAQVSDDGAAAAAMRAVRACAHHRERGRGSRGGPPADSGSRWTRALRLRGPCDANDVRRGSLSASRYPGRKKGGWMRT